MVERTNAGGFSGELKLNDFKDSKWFFASKAIDYLTLGDATSGKIVATGAGNDRVVVTNTKDPRVAVHLNEGDDYVTVAQGAKVSVSGDSGRDTMFLNVDAKNLEFRDLGFGAGLITGKAGTPAEGTYVDIHRVEQFTFNGQNGQFFRFKELDKLLNG